MNATTKKGEREMIKEIKWDTQDGRPVIVTVSLITERSIGRDDWAGEVKKPCCTIRVAATVGGKDTGGLGNMSPVTAHPIVVACIGNLGLTSENKKRVQDAIDDIEASEYVQAWRANEEKSRRESKDYEEHYAAVVEMMGD
jgi:hypothetical protein